MRKAFDIEDVNLDELIATAMDDPQAMTGEIKQLRGIKNFGDLHTAYRQFCKNEALQNSFVDIGQVIEFYNKALAQLPEHTQLKGLRLPVPASYSMQMVSALPKYTSPIIGASRCH